MVRGLPKADFKQTNNKQIHRPIDGFFLMPRSREVADNMKESEHIEKNQTEEKVNSSENVNATYSI